MRNLSRYVAKFPFDTMIVTAVIISSIPNTRRDVNASWKTRTPKTTAVKGSSEPRMAVGVGPM